MKDLEKLRDLAQPLLDYLEETGNPYNEIVINDKGVYIKQSIAFTPIKRRKQNEFKAVLSDKQ